MIASVIGQYWLFGKLLGVEAAITGENAGRMAAFVGLAIVTHIGVGFATLLLIIPGLFVASRWLMSPAYFVQDKLPVFDAMTRSWDETRGNTLTVALTLVVVVLFSFIAAAMLAVTTFFQSRLLEALSGAITGEVFTILLIGLSVATYRALSNSTEQVAEVFQ